MSGMSQVKTGSIAANGTELYYEEMGEGHPLVLIHGGYMDRRMWDDQFAVFAERYRMIRYDVRGFGKSAMPPTPYTDRQDLYELLQALGVQSAYLLGLSLGGVIAVDFALEHPAMVDALVLVGAPVSGYPIEQQFSPEQLQQEMQRWAPFEKAIEEKNIPAMVECIMNNPTLVPSPNYPEARQRVRANLSEYDFAWVLHRAPHEELTPPAYERLAEIHAPTLIVVGAEDHFQLHKSADKFEQGIADARRVEIARTHHMPNMERPEEFNTIVLGFLNKL